MRENEINVAFIGNPNCGKTSLFNDYTGAKLKVANWPGVTVEKKEGAMKYHEHNFKLVDLPGIYSLTSYTMEEKLSRQYILEDEVDVIIDVVDASMLERNLYLTLQLIELGKPVVIALNMMDIVIERGMEIDLHRLPEMLGVPVIPVSARKKTGLDILMHSVAHHKGRNPSRTEHHHQNGSHIHNHHEELTMVYSDEIEDKIDFLKALLKDKFPNIINFRWHAIKLLEQDKEIIELYPIDTSGIVDKNYESEIIRQKYDFIEEIIEEVLVNKSAKSEKTDKIDKILTHKFWGVPVFFGIMAIVFLLTFTVGDWLKGFFEIGIGWVSNGTLQTLTNMNVGNPIISLIVDGIIAGVGAVMTFLPNIAILFFALALLEDSGYMSRVAYVMDRIMSKMGLSGRAFIPMLLGFGCSVPAVMASRALENKRDRLKTILVTPFMSCSARLPIYLVFSQLFFGKYAMLAAYSMYVIGFLVAIFFATVMGKIDRKKGVAENTLLIELPEYKSPNKRTVFIYVWEKVKDYFTRAGTTIFVASIVLWFLLNFGTHGMVDNMGDSFAAMFGKALVPIMSPTGLGQWQMIVALISGVAAKEVVVSSMGVLFALPNIASATGLSAFSGILSDIGFTAINSYSMMLFSLLYIPCVATIATIKRESNSWKWATLSVFLQVGTAWVVSTIFFQLASLIFR